MCQNSLQLGLESAVLRYPRMTAYFTPLDTARLSFSKPLRPPRHPHTVMFISQQSLFSPDTVGMTIDTSLGRHTTRGTHLKVCLIKDKRKNAEMQKDLAINHVNTLLAHPFFTVYRHHHSCQCL